MPSRHTYPETECRTGFPGAEPKAQCTRGDFVDTPGLVSASIGGKWQTPFSLKVKIRLQQPLVYTVQGLTDRMSSNYGWNHGSKSRRRAITPRRATVDEMASFAVQTDPQALAWPNEAMSHLDNNITNHHEQVLPAYQATAPSNVAFANPEMLASSSTNSELGHPADRQILTSSATQPLLGLSIDAGVPAPASFQSQFDQSPDEVQAPMDVDRLPDTPPTTPEGQTFSLPVRCRGLGSLAALMISHLYRTPSTALRSTPSPIF